MAALAELVASIAGPGPLKIPHRDVSHLDAQFCDAAGRLRVMPCAAYAAVEPMDLLYWASTRGYYGLPTVELIHALRTAVAPGRTIEIGAGSGTLGRALGIPMTDSYVQAALEYKLLYGMLGQQTAPYGADVRRLEALEAAREYRPTVILASWVTQVCKTDTEAHAFAQGVDEEALLALPFLRTYIVLGTTNVHDHKRIRKQVPAGWRFSEASLPCLWSRVLDQKTNRIYVWERR